MTAEPLSKPAPGGTEHAYRFGVGAPCNVMLKSGWGEPERGFVWSEGKAATLVLPALRGGGTLRLSLWGYVAGRIRSQDLMVFVNGSLLACFKVKERRVFDLHYPDQAGAESLDVVFFLPSAAPPAEVEGVPDERCLGVALSTIQHSVRTGP